MAMPSEELFTKGVQMKLAEYTAQVMAFYDQIPSQDELVQQLAPMFLADYALFGDDVALQAFVDQVEADMAAPQARQDGVNQILGTTPTNAQLDSLIAQLEAAKV